MDDKNLKLNPTAIPQGTRTYLFEEAAHKRFLEQAIHSTLRARGFQEIVTPPIEYYDSAVIGLTEAERNRIIRFTEGDSGRLVALRADITSQIARSAATHLSGRPLPLRLCYTGSVFRTARTGKNEQYVLHQYGMEVVGHAGPEADIEVILAAASALGAALPGSFAISLGHAGFVASLLDGLGPEPMSAVRRALEKKDKTALGRLLDSETDKTAADKIIALTSLYGGEEVLRKAAKLCGGNGAQKAALDNLTAVYDALKKARLGENITIDIGDMRGFGYYTGTTVEIFSESGLPIGSGGRYDNLVKRFGPDLPAVGFAFNLDRMIDGLRRQSAPPAWMASDILLLDAEEDAAQKIRDAGLLVTRPFGKMDDDDAASYAKKMNIPGILRRLNGGSYEHTDVESGKRKKCGLDEFINERFGEPPKGI